MGEKLSLCSGLEAVQKFQKNEWTVIRQKSSHVMMTKAGYQWILSIPQHKELYPGLLRKLIRQANLTKKTFNKLKKSGCVSYLQYNFDLHFLISLQILVAVCLGPPD